LAELTALSQGDVSQIIIEACVKNGVMPGEILEEMAEYTFGY
jgi:hypothetical protein